MKRTMPRWLRRLLMSLAGVIAAAVALAAILFLLLQTPLAKRLVAHRLETELTAATGFTVDIGGLEGTLPLSAAVTDVRVADAGGPWLMVDRLTVDWRPMDLFQRRLHITSVTAGTVALTHLPASSQPQPETKKGLDLAIALPRFPLPTAIDGLRVGRIDVAPALLGEAAVLELTGRAELGGAARDAALTLAATRIDGRDGRISLQFGQSGARLTLAASIEEPAGGLIARALALPGLPPVSLHLGGDGPATAWRGRLQLAAGSTHVDGDLTLAVDEALAVAFDAHAQDAGRLAPAIAAYVPPAVDLAARLRWHPDERLDVQQLSIAAPEATAALTGVFDFAGNSVQASVDMTIADAARWRPLMTPASLHTAHLWGTIAGSLDQPTFALQTTVGELTTPDLSIARAEGQVDGRATLQDDHLVTALSIAGEGNASGLTTATPQLQTIIGDSATWSLRAALDLLHGNADIGQAKLAANGSTLDLAGSIGGYGRAVVARVQAELASIAPFATLLERPVDGRLSLTAKLSGDAIARRLSADVDARLADLAVAEPMAAKLLGPAPTIVGRLATSPAGIEFHALRIEGAGATVTADGTAAMDGRSLDLNLDAAVTDIAPVADSLGISAGGRLAGMLHLARTPADPGLWFEGAADLQDLAVDERAADLLGSAVHATAEGVLGTTDVQLAAARLAGAAVALEASGKAGDTLDLAYRLELPKLAALSRLAGEELAGNATVTGNLRGARDAPTLSGALSAKSLRVADLTVASADGTFSARNLGAHPEGDLALDLQARQQRLSLATAYRRKEDGTLALSGLKLTVPQGSVTGDLALLPGGALDGHISGDIRDLAPLGVIVDRSIAGAAALDLSFAPAKRGQSIDAKIDVRNPSFAMDAGAPLSAQQLTVKARVSDAFGTPDGAAELRVTEGARGPLSLTRGALTAEGDGKYWKVRLQAEGKQGQPFAVDAAGALIATAAEQRLRLERLDGMVGGIKVRLNAPATLSRDSRGYALAGLDASIGDGRLTGAGGVGGKQVDLRLSLADLPLETLAAFAPRLDVGGKASADLRLGGTPSAPTGHGEVRLTALSVAGTKISETVGVNGTIELDVQDGRAAVSANLGGSPDLNIDGQLTVPVAFRLQPFAADLAADAPIAGKVVGKVDLGLVPRIVDLHGDTLGGQLVLDMTVAGTPGAPRLAGDARLSAGSYASADAGTVLRDVTAVISGDNDRLLLRSLSASDGGQGRLEASGSAGLARAAAARYDGTLTLKSFTVVNRTDAVATASGRLQVENEAQGARLGGEVTVESAELRVPDSLPARVVKLDVVEINTPPDRVKPTRRIEEGGGLPVALAVTVKIPGRAFLRGRGIDSEWRGKLQVAGTMAKPDITGRLEVVRGRVDLLGQPFNVDNGAVNFVGGGAIDPELDFTALGQAQDVTARVRVTGRVSQPKFELGTDSGLPPEEAMSRLLFGKSAGSLSSAQAIQLAQAAAELSGGGPGVLDKLRRTFGLDVLRVGTSSGAPDSASVEAGKYVSDNVYLKVEQGVTPESRQAGVEVRVLPHVTVEGGVGAQGNGKVGVNWRYDY